MQIRLVLLSLVVVTLTWSCPLALQASVVGQFSQVQGQVDVRPQGEGQAVAARVGDGVRPWDVIQTRSDSRAQLRFQDDTIVTIAPSTSIVVQEYFFDASRGSRRAVIQAYRGLVYIAVSRILDTQQPDFLFKTVTAVLGVRGTRFFVLPGVNFTCTFNEAGGLEARNILPSLLKKTVLKSMEYCFIKAGMEPTDPQTLTPKQIDRLRQWLNRGVPPQVFSGDPTQIFSPNHPWPN